jgi:uracil-DNA glycosylase family 4
LRLTDAWITAPVRCAPPANKPTPAERDTCAPYLHRELALLDRVRVIVALGSFGYDAVWSMLRASGRPGLELPPRRPRFAHLLEVPCGGVTVLGAFHPSQQNTFTGKLTPEMLDAVFVRAAELRTAR